MQLDSLFAITMSYHARAVPKSSFLSFPHPFFLTLEDFRGS